MVALVELMWWTGARPDELFALTPESIDRTEKVWRVDLVHHKNAARGKRRSLFFGPQAQAVLQPLLLRPAGRTLFSPRDAMAEQKAERRANRQTPPTKQTRDRDAAAKTHDVGDTYDAGSLYKAVQRAIADANAERAEKKLEPIAPWHPYQLRHSAATRIRAEHGLEAARTLLGHTGAAMTEVYAEADLQAAAKVMEAAG